MIFQSCWFSSLLFIASVTGHAYPPAGLKPRYLANGTGISLPLTTPSPYPTGSANGTAIPTGSIYPTRPILPSGVSSNTSTSTAIPNPTPSPFYLVVADTGTPFDGDYLFIGMDNERSGLELLLFGPQEPTSEPSPTAASVFSLSADGILRQDSTGLIASYFDNYGLFVFEYPDALESEGESAATCKIVGGALTCQNGADGVFSALYQAVVDEYHPEPSVYLAPTVPAGYSPLTLLVVPA